LTFAVNHLAYSLLGDLLLNTLRASAPARIINVSSNAYTHGKIEFDNLQGKRSYSSRAYGNSKLAILLFTIELAWRLEGTGVTVNALHPGLVNTGFGKNHSGVSPRSIRCAAAANPTGPAPITAMGSAWVAINFAPFIAC
jgi:NAD(P)-dependent dehydrogenase (short-subunit alcohol dehydrogenase family)